MIQFLDQLPDSTTHIEADICIVGAGATGLALASEFLNSKLRVVVVEAGGRNPDPKTQSLYNANVTGNPHQGVHNGRARVYGGTTTLWGGQALPLNTSVFEPRPWAGSAGWPIKLSDLEPYFSKVEDIMSIDHHPFQFDIWQKFGLNKPDLDPNLVDVEISRWSPAPNFASRLNSQIESSSSVTLVLNANLTDLCLADDKDVIDTVVCKSLNGKQLVVKAKSVVMCCGAVEISRALLASKGLDQGNRFNRNGLVGRYFQDHVDLICAEVTPRNRRKFQDLFENFYIGNVKLTPKFHLSDTKQEDLQVQNVACTILFETLDTWGVTVAKHLFHSFKLRKKETDLKKKLTYVFKDLGDVIRLGWRVKVKKRTMAASHGRILLVAHTEQQPNAESRITLSNELDALGVPKLNLNWKVGEESQRTVQAMLKVIDGEFRRLDLGEVQPLSFVNGSLAEFLPHVIDANHMMGGTIMGEDPNTSVVNSDCRSHEIENLYIACSSVFPIGGYSNPTFSALALTFRIADKLKASFA